jgi:1-acyl-sn-glycerol-3-phosphate acyltransferase
MTARTGTGVGTDIGTGRSPSAVVADAADAADATDVAAPVMEGAAAKGASPPAAASAIAAAEEPRASGWPLPAPVKALLAGLSRGITRVLLRLLSKTTVSGSEHVPLRGPCILAFNHLGYLDGALLYALTPRPDVTPVVAAMIGAKPLERIVVTMAGGIWIARGASDRAALETALAVLAAGRAVAIAPEGRISTTGGLLPAQPGAAFLAVRGRAPIVPVAITGSERAWTDLRRFRRPTMTLTFGEPIPAESIAPGKAGRTAAMESLMQRLAAMLPERYRGKYRG